MSATDRPTGVLVMAYGTPPSPKSVEAFYTDVRRGRPPSPEQLADLVRRYDAIGGVSPLAQRTDEQVAGVQAALEARRPGGFVCRLGTKHAVPSVEAGVDALAEAGARELVGIVLAPHYSRGSIGQYVERAGGRAAERGLSSTFVEHWHDEPVLVELLAERVRAAVDALGDAGRTAIDRGEFILLVTAHSLPVRVVAGGDRYVDQLRRTGELVAAAAGVDRWEIGWQSAGRTAEPWLGPDILEVVRSLPERGIRAVVVCPAGFTSDHLEVLFDLDVDARRVAGEVGLVFERTASLNADPRLCAALAGLVADAAGARPRPDAGAS